jgi:hypothetical protein
MSNNALLLNSPGQVKNVLVRTLIKLKAAKREVELKQLVELVMNSLFKMFTVGSITERGHPSAWLEFIDSSHKIRAA